MPVIIDNRKVSEGYHLICVGLDASCTKPMPGQFYMFRCGPCSDPLLRRPLSIHGYSEIGDNSARLDFLFKIAGVGTTLLSQMQKGDGIEVIGPLGNGFDLPSYVKSALFIGGGIGIAPLSYLMECLAEKRVLQSARLIAGASTAKHIIALEKFKELSACITLYTEDGSLGKMGCATDGLNEALKGCTANNTIVFACGPAGMLRGVAQQCIAQGIPCQVSLEQRMACGVGACLGCAVRGKDTIPHEPDKIYKRVCKDGPVFKADEIQW